MNPPADARDLAAELLIEDDKKRAYARDLLPAARGRLSDPRDRSLLTELAYGVIRRRGTLDAVLGLRSRRALDRLARPARVALRLALYQILFLDRVPVHAAVHHAVGWTRRRTNPRTAGYVNAVLRGTASLVLGLARGAEDPRRDLPREDGSAMRLDAPVFPDPAKDLAGNLAGRYSMPTWLVARWLDRVGEAVTRARLRTAITRPPLGLRARGDRDDLYRALEAAGATVRAGPLDTSLLVEGGREGAAVEAVERGEAWIQDATAQRTAVLARVRPGDRVLDLCAAPGGKTLHVADLLGRGEVVACDVAEEKTVRLEGLRRHLPEGVSLAVRRIDPEAPIPFEASSFDVVIVDAPCTNTGVLRRRVEARWRLDPGDVAALAALQRGLLDRAWPLLKPGGRLVYATCSLESEENEDVAAGFLAAHDDAVEEQRVSVPGGRDQDGGFAVRFGKK